MKYKKKKGIIEESIHDTMETVFESLKEAFEGVGESFKYLENILPPDINLDIHREPIYKRKVRKNRTEENTYILNMVKEERINIEDAEVLLKAVNAVNSDKEDNMMILNMFKDDKISLEEADKLIRAVGK
jgi:hypothetical protein